jgi:hypothetical protein
MTDDTLDLTGCPQCAETAEIVDRFDLPSTDGPAPHVTVQCVRRHRFTMSAEHLLRPVPAAAHTVVTRGSDR